MKLYVYMFCSRNKDNREIEGFKERVKLIVDYDENEPKIREEFSRFAAAGLPGEKTRLYRTLNARNEEKVMKDFIIKLLELNPPVNMVNRMLASVAQQTRNRAESKWLFDFDTDDLELAEEFCNDMSAPGTIHKTPNGYAIVADHGFDTTELMRKWINYDVTLKRDNLLFLDMKESKVEEY